MRWTRFAMCALVGLVALSGGCSNPGGPSETVCISEYFPLRDGLSWTYTGSDRYQTTVECDGPQSVAAHQVYQLTGDIGQYFFVSGDGWHFIDHPYHETPVMILPSEVSKGTSCSGTGSFETLSWTCVSTNASVHVPAGDFSGCLEIKEVGTHEGTVTTERHMWFAPGVGLVKQVSDVGGGCDSGYVLAMGYADLLEIELSSYSVPDSIPDVPDSARQITSDPARDQGPRFSPLGDLIAFTSYRSGNAEIWTIAVSDGELTQITDHPSGDAGPTWSPDGSMIAFLSYRSGNADIWVVPSAGGAAVQLTTDPADDLWPSWSPDGAAIAFQSGRSGNSDIWSIPATGGSATQLTFDPGWDGGAQYSSDGSVIGFQSDRGSDWAVWQIPASGGSPQLLLTDPVYLCCPHWSPDGSRLAYYSRRSGNGDVWVIDLPAGTPQQITTHAAQDAPGNWSPDGSKIVFYSERSGDGDIWVIDYEEPE